MAERLEKSKRVLVIGIAVDITTRLTYVLLKKEGYQNLEYAGVLNWSYKPSEVLMEQDTQQPKIIDKDSINQTSVIISVNEETTQELSRKGYYKSREQKLIQLQIKHPPIEGVINDTTLNNLYEDISQQIKPYL